MSPLRFLLVPLKWMKRSVSAGPIPSLPRHTGSRCPPKGRRLSDGPAALGPGDRNNCTRSQGAEVSVWTLSPAGHVTLGQRPAFPEPRVKQGGWTNPPLSPFQD